jgi:hypothetical protein
VYKMMCLGQTRDTFSNQTHKYRLMFGALVRSK